MTNLKDEGTSLSRLLDLKNQKESEKKAAETRFGSATLESPVKKPSFTTERTTPSSLFSADKSPLTQVAPRTEQRPPLKADQTSTLFSRPTPNTPPTFERKSSMFTQQSTVNTPVDKKPVLQTSQTSVFSQRDTTPKPGTTFTTTAANQKPTFAPSAIPPKPMFTTAASTAASQLSFKERMEALQKKQAEARAVIAASRPDPAAPRALFTSKPPIVFGEKKPVPLFTATRTQSDVSTVSRQNTIVATQSKSDYKISTEEFTLLRDFLYEQSGIFVAENRKYLMENRLSSRLRTLGLRNFNEYHNYLRFDNNRMTELNKLFENMTTNETSFFRNNPQLDIFRDKVLARVINEQRAKGQKKIHIWSAGCSSGEEPYTIGIILHQLLKTEIASWDIKITANDLSLAMLETAKKGLYTEYALRTTAPEIISQFFTKEENKFRILPKVQKLVNFGQINLASTPQLSRVERSHIVFCRNVIIYFDDEMKRHVINAFYDNLLPGGSLLIGHSESLHSISRTFVPEHYTGAIVYGKKS